MRLYEYKHAYKCDVPYYGGDLCCTSLEFALICGINALYSPDLSVLIMSSNIDLMPTPYDDFEIAHLYNGVVIEHLQCELNIDANNITITTHWTDRKIDKSKLLFQNHEPVILNLSLLRKLARGELQ
jgi:hypothetical protein